MSAAAAALHSDHLNFLIYRYLQEFGHEKTARAFYRDWHRPVEHDDPESFPFAHAVQRNDLVSIVQDGLHHDELLARVRKCDRRFRWTVFDARDSVERQDGFIENGAGSRPPSRTRRKPRLQGHIRAAEDFVMPAQKRQRRSEASEAQMNGDRDAMDVDAASASADAEDDNDLASPTGASEAEGVESVVRYDSMEVGTQTERTKTSTMHWKIDRPGVHISHCIWNPSSDPKNAGCLLAVGSSLCRFYQLPNSIDSEAQEITHADEPSLPLDSVVTTAAWRPDGSAASCAIDGSKELPDGYKMSSQSLVEYSRDLGSLPFQPGPSLLESLGIVLQLRYSPAGGYLLQARYHHHNRGSLQVWRAPRTSAETLPGPREPLARCIFEQPVNDACWIAENSFLVCGAEGLSSIYELAERDAAIKDEDSETDKLLQSLVERRVEVVEEKIDLDKVRFDRRHELAVFVSAESKRLVVASTTVTPNKTKEANYILDLPGQPTDAHFQLSHAPDALANMDDLSQPSYLAVAFEDRACIVYGIARSPESGIVCNEVASLSLVDGPALALSWSPNAQHLAVSSADVVQVWHADTLRRKNGIRHTAEPLVTWRRPVEANGIPNGTHNGQTTTQSEPSLSWSADGESLAFAVDQQIAVIRFRPPLNPKDIINAEPNGRPTP